MMPHAAFDCLQSEERATINCSWDDGRVEPSITNLKWIFDQFETKILKSLEENAKEGGKSECKELCLEA